MSCGNATDLREKAKFFRSTKKFCGEFNSFERESKSFASERKVSWGSLIFCPRIKKFHNQMQFFTGEHNIYERKEKFCKWAQSFFGGMQLFCERTPQKLQVKAKFSRNTKVLQGNSIILQEKAKVLLVNTKFLRET